MYEGPQKEAAIVRQDGSKAHLIVRLRREELKGFRRPEKQQELLEEAIRPSALKNQNKIVEYHGLLSEDVYNENQEVQSTRNINMETTKTGSFERRSYRHVGRYFDILSNGLYLCPRSLVRPRLFCDSIDVQRLLTKPNLSAGARAVLGRTNYRGPYYLKHDTTEDGFFELGARNRSIHTIMTLLCTSMMRERYTIAYAAFCALIRVPEMEFRLVWNIGLELIVQRIKSGEAQPNADETFMQWMVVNYPSSRRVRRSRWKRFEKSNELYLNLVNIQLRKGRVERALSTMEAYIDQSPFSTDANNLALYGILNLEAGRKNPEKLVVARKYFDLSIKHGGVVLPSLYQQSRAGMVVGESESTSGGSESGGSESGGSESGGSESESGVEV